MSKVNLRMKNKQTTKFNLDSSGDMVMYGVKSTSDSASKGISAQPAGPMTAEENKGNPGPAPSTQTPKLVEPSTGAPAERVDPNSLLDADVQPAEKNLEESPAQAGKVVKAEAVNTTPTTLPPAPHEKVPAATADKVLKTETAKDNTLVNTEANASDSLKGKQPKKV